MSSAWSSFAGSCPAVGDDFDGILPNDGNKHVYFVSSLYIFAQHSLFWSMCITCVGLTGYLTLLFLQQQLHVL